MNKWPYSKELENWCHFQFVVKQEIEHTQGLYLPLSLRPKKKDRQQYPWLADSGVRFKAVENMDIVFVEGFFAN